MRAWMRSIVLGLLFFITAGVVQAKVIIGNNISGWSVKSAENPGGYTEHPFGTNPNAAGAVLSALAEAKVKALSLNGPIRFMDAQQTVGSQIDSWAAVSTDNLSLKGITIDSIVAVSNQMHAVPWINAPQKTAAFFDNPNADVTQSWAYQAGRKMALGLDPRLKTIKFEFSNELWNLGDQHQGTDNLNRARASSQVTPGISDNEKASQMAYIDTIKSAAAFKQGVDSAGKGFAVQVEFSGFIANQYWAYYGLTKIKAANNPAWNALIANGRLPVAPYAPGSPSDIGGIKANDTYASIISRTRAYVSANYPNWLKGNYDMAKSFGLKGLDYYETMALSTYDFDSGTNLLIDMNRSNDPAVKAYFKEFLDYAMDGIDGSFDGKNSDPGATMILFASAGIPYYENFGQWGTWESYSQGNNTAKSQAIPEWVLANSANVDAFAVPEPSLTGAACLLTLLGVMMRRPRGPRPPRGGCPNKPITATPSSVVHLTGR